MAGPPTLRGLQTLAAIPLLSVVASGCIGGSSDGPAAQSADRPRSEWRPLAQEETFRAANDFAARLTRALRRRERSKFVSAFTGDARTRVRRWWSNVMPLGTTHGTVVVDGTVPVEAEPAPVLEVGLHNRLDPTPDGKLAEPVRRYRIRLLTKDGLGSIVVSDRWDPIDGPAPWDGGPLAIRKAKQVVVAAPRSEAALARRTLPQASDAATWLLDLLEKFAPKMVDQRGFVVFVSARKRTRNGWFQTVKHLRGWTGDALGYAKPLPQVRSGDPKIADEVVATAPIVVSPPRPGRLGTSLMVHEMVHAVMAPTFAWFGEKPPPAWPGEGLAEYLEQNYLHGDFNRSGGAALVGEAVRSGTFDGRPPSTEQLYGGSSGGGARAYALAATAYRFLDERYGGARMFAAAAIAGNSGTPFAGILDEQRGSELTFYDPGFIRRQWAEWVRAQYG